MQLHTRYKLDKKKNTITKHTNIFIRNKKNTTIPTEKRDGISYAPPGRGISEYGRVLYECNHKRTGR